VIKVLQGESKMVVSYGMNNNEGLVVVFHFDGKTFDMSILDISNNVFEVKATNGDTFLGGEDFVTHYCNI
jgi:molecular chaperone DnaK